MAATLIVAIALSAGSAILVWRFRQSLDNNRRNAAVARAADIASLAAAGRLPAVLGLPNEDASYAQVIDGRGHVIAASANIAGEAALGPPARSGNGVVVTRATDSPVADSDSSMMVTLPVTGAPGSLTVITGYSLAATDFAVNSIELALFVGLPLLLILVGATAWAVVGRALQPIDAIRAEAARITSDDLHRRLPEPPSGDEIARLARTMNDMLDRIERSVEREKSFIADASHELRSPLASLRAQLEVGVAGGDLTDWQATAADALAEESRIEQLVRDLLILARLDQHRPSRTGPSSEAETLTVTDLSQIAAEEQGRRVARPAVEVRTHIEGPAPVAMSADFARRVVANLVDNAQRHAASFVDITVATRGPDAELVIEDDGPGVPVEDRDRVFERFTRLDPARSSDDGGAGLGLAIVKEIVSRHGGRVGFTDSSRGARVLVCLPMAAPQEHGAAEVPTDAASREVAAPS